MEAPEELVGGHRRPVPLPGAQFFGAMSTLGTQKLELRRGGVVSRNQCTAKDPRLVRQAAALDEQVSQYSKGSGRARLLVQGCVWKILSRQFYACLPCVSV